MADQANSSSEAIFIVCDTKQAGHFGADGHGPTGPTGPASAPSRLCTSCPTTARREPQRHQRSSTTSPEGFSCSPTSPSTAECCTRFAETLETTRSIHRPGPSATRPMAPSARRWTSRLDTDGRCRFVDGSVRLTDQTTNPNYEQFDNRQVPFAGDHRWIDAEHGQTFGTWTDWRKRVPGSDPREPASDAAGGDVDQ
jgi:hypothetical protein